MNLSRSTRTGAISWLERDYPVMVVVKNVAGVMRIWQLLSCISIQKKALRLLELAKNITHFFDATILSTKTHNPKPICIFFK